VKFVEVFLGWGEDAVEHLLDLIVREYDAWSEPHLAMVKEKIEAAASAYRQGYGPLSVNQFVELLSEWDSISQPVQLLEESKGHEEPRSKEIYKIVRDFSLWLANENGHYYEAFAISRPCWRPSPSCRQSQLSFPKTSMPSSPSPRKPSRSSLWGHSLRPKKQH
jgi:hypothetical protein